MVHGHLPIKAGLLGLSLLLATACSAPPVSLRPIAARSYVGDPKVLVVSTEPAFPPFVYLTEAGDLVGFDVDLITEVARRLGLEVYFAYIPFDGLMATLEAETADASVDAMTITARRDESIDFSRPYFKSGLAIAVHRDAVGIQTLADLAGKKIAVKLGTTGAELAASVPNTQLVTFDSAEKALLDLAKGNVDAVIKDKPTTLGMLTLAKIQHVRLLDQLLTEEYYGIALPPGSPNRPLIDATLEDMLADGTIAELHRKWFGYDPEPVPLKAIDPIPVP
ncbi:basic amino acid ABC transporter substrate-binding protein [Nodosilinea sp. E11]|uniref:basic amino acid ABC transporter substrate-binding protein n=1 Tax=Nodosilinea sp. E11 TaxID=3037479 RepID=UPI002934DD15|nr:basic amino acid ABC transporter substrate-binding protein [Nodosilinea sp. E11]WOD40447.1 basic amino acid ABC transporter substrate-binding protein [Nodosilinea sp. E11]